MNNDLMNVNRDDCCTEGSAYIVSSKEQITSKRWEVLGKAIDLAREIVTLLQWKANQSSNIGE